jgi:hypothetical protein
LLTAGEEICVDVVDVDHLPAIIFIMSDFKFNDTILLHFDHRACSTWKGMENGMRRMQTSTKTEEICAIFVVTVQIWFHPSRRDEVMKIFSVYLAFFKMF